jgi:inhibitor of cysteine peptidase
VHVSRRAALLCVLAAVSLMVSACSMVPGGGPSASAVKVGPEASGTRVPLTAGQTLEVALPGNPTTGFDWALSGTLPSQLASVGVSYESTAPAGMVGAGGVRAFIYRAAAAGTGTLNLVYARPWETGVAPESTFTVTVVVR